MTSEVFVAVGLHRLIQMRTVGRTNRPVQNLPVAAFLILNTLRLPQTKMDVNCFFLLILHNQALLKVAFGPGVLSALATVAFSQMETSTPPHRINSQISFKKTYLMQRQQRALVSSSAKGLSAAKRNEAKSLQGWKMALDGALTQQKLWHVLRPFFLFLFWLGLWPSRKASKGTALNRSKLLLETVSLSGYCVSF